jgi:segregation and condensation protein A
MVPPDKLLEFDDLKQPHPSDSLSSEPALSSTSAYKVKLEVFEGPLDLLLFLIKKEEVSIYDIPIARITEQYLDYLRLMEDLDIAVASDFLVMAAMLIYIKSKMLLPPGPTAAGEEEVEDPRQELVQRLLEYQKYKAAAEMLWSKAEVEQGVFTRGPVETDEANPEIAATTFDLFQAFMGMMDRLKERKELVIARDEITTAEKIAEIQTLLQANARVDVTALFESARTRRELLTLFLAVLELVKEMVIRLLQTERFGRIIAVKVSASRATPTQAISADPETVQPS